MHAFRMGRVVLVAAVLFVGVSGSRAVNQETAVEVVPLVVAQAQGTEQGELRPRYHPVPPEEKSWYNSTYLFALTRGVAGSTMAPAAKVPLYLFTVPLDLALLPVAAFGGLFG